MLCACSHRGIVPPTDWQQHFWRTLAAKLVDCSAQDLSTIMRSSGHLGIAPPADLLLTLCRYCKDVLPDMSQQDVAGAVLGLAYLGLWDVPLWPVLWQRAWELLPRDSVGWKAEDQLYAQQLYHIYHAAAVERPGKLRTPGADMLDAARASWAAGEQKRWQRESARCYANVSACLTDIGVAHASARWCDRAERTVKIALDGDSRVALEVNRPSFVLSDGRLCGPQRLRHRVLRAHSWRVVELDYQTWRKQLETPEEREEREDHLRKLLS